MPARIAPVRRTASDAVARVKVLEREVARLRRQVDKLSEPKPTIRQRVLRRLRRLAGRPTVPGR
mgnify:CR=1 FL=1